MFPLFPLSSVVFPDESLNLHIFEPRYRQLIHDCQTEGITFGIPAFLDNQVKDYGTEIELLEVVNQYSDGRMDIRTKGKRLFSIQKFSKQMPQKLYAGGEVTFHEVHDESTLSERILLVENILRLYEILNVKMDVSAEDEFLSFKFGHKLGLNTHQEYQLITFTSESERIRFITHHLTRSIPILREAEEAKRRIKMNGHFRNYDPLDFS